MASFAIEYRKIGLLPTRLGNERIRITADGRVYHSRNTREGDKTELWTADWRAVGQLEAVAMLDLAREIAGSHVLSLPPESIDQTAEGGQREEMDVTLNDQTRRVVVQNTNPPAFRRAVTLLWGAVSRAESKT